MLRVSHTAANIALTPNTTELVIYTKHLPNSALLIKLTLSKPKVEKVVNAPRNPVAINNFSSLGKFALSLNRQRFTFFNHKANFWCVHNCRF